MLSKIKILIEGLRGRRKLNIYQRTLRLSILGGLLTSVVMSGLYVYAGLTIGATLREKTFELGALGAQYIEDEVTQQVKARMIETTQVRSQLINNELEDAVEDVQWLSDFISLNLKNPELHLPHELPNALYQDVHSGEPYIFFSPELAANGLDEKILREIGIASACEDLLLTMSNQYDCIVVASKNGYVIRIDKLDDKNSLVPLCKEPLKSSYDPRERDWYIQGQKVSRPTFTDLYISTTNGEPRVSVLMPYFDNDGIAGVICLDVNPKTIYEQINASRLKGRDTVFVLGRRGEILFSTGEDEDLKPYILDRDLRNDDDPSLARAARRMVYGEKDIAAVDIDNAEYYLAFAPMKSIGWSFGTLINKSEIFLFGEQIKEDVNEYIGDYTFALDNFLFKISVASFGVVMIILVALFQRSLKEADNFIKPIHDLISGVQEVAGGNLDKKLDIKTGDEIESLAENFNAMTDELKDYMTNLKLDVAAQIQRGMLPKDFPARKDFELSAMMEPAKAVGGDFYDFYFLDEERLVLTIADVSDKGVPAALFMVMTKALLKDNILINPDNLSAVMFETNNQLCQQNDADMFVTLFVAIVNLSSGEVTFVNAGHNPPLVGHKDFHFLPRAQSPIFGTIPDLTFSSNKFLLAPGDTFFLYTDGVTEAMDINHELFGEERLQLTLDKISVVDAKKFLADVNAAVKNFVGAAPQSDDITMLVLVLRDQV